MGSREITIHIEGVGAVSGVLDSPSKPAVAFAFAHGAGAGMHHAFMSELARDLAERGVVVLRYNFPYMEAGRRAPSPQRTLVETVRSAVRRMKELAGDIPLFAGGKSMGGRMTSIAESRDPLGVRGLVFLGFPLHAAGKKSTHRSDHLMDAHVPLLFVQGTRDRLADIELVRSLVHGPLSDRASLEEIESGDHSFRVPKRVGLTNDQILRGVAKRVSEWMVVQS